MKISLDWVGQFVDLSDIPPETIADRLTLSTSEVEGFEVLRRAVEGVMIGEVVAVEPMGTSAEAQSARLHLATVACGPRQYRTVCGAPNVRLGMKAPLRRPACGWPTVWRFAGPRWPAGAARACSVRPWSWE